MCQSTADVTELGLDASRCLQPEAWTVTAARTRQVAAPGGGGANLLFICLDCNERQSELQEFSEKLLVINLTDTEVKQAACLHYSLSHSRVITAPHACVCVCVQVFLIKWPRPSTRSVAILTTKDNKSGTRWLPTRLIQRLTANPSVILLKWQHLASELQSSLHLVSPLITAR